MSSHPRRTVLVVLVALLMLAPAIPAASSGSSGGAVARPHASPLFAPIASDTDLADRYAEYRSRARASLNAFLSAWKGLVAARGSQAVRARLAVALAALDRYRRVSREMRLTVLSASVGSGRATCATLIRNHTVARDARARAFARGIRLLLAGDRNGVRVVGSAQRVDAALARALDSAVRACLRRTAPPPPPPPPPPPGTGPQQPITDAVCPRDPLQMQYGQAPPYSVVLHRFLQVYPADPHFWKCLYGVPGNTLDESYVILITFNPPSKAGSIPSGDCARTGKTSSIGEIYSQLRYLTVGGGNRKLGHTVVGGDLGLKQRTLALAEAQGVGQPCP
ncbi:MAG: hypothetical protein AB1416_11595 [Actinomycetota bacterium]